MCAPPCSRKPCDCNSDSMKLFYICLSKWRIKVRRGSLANSWNDRASRGGSSGLIWVCSWLPAFNFLWWLPRSYALVSVFLSSFLRKLKNGERTILSYCRHWLGWLQIGEHSNCLALRFPLTLWFVLSCLEYTFFFNGMASLLSAFLHGLSFRCGFGLCDSDVAIIGFVLFSWSYAQVRFSLGQCFRTGILDAHPVFDGEWENNDINITEWQHYSGIAGMDLSQDDACSGISRRRCWTLIWLLSYSIVTCLHLL